MFNIDNFHLQHVSGIRCGIVNMHVISYQNLHCSSSMLGVLVKLGNSND